MAKRLDNLLLVAVFAAVVVAIYIVPRLIPTSESDVISAAAAVGYNSSAAFWTVFVWFVLATLVFALPSIKQILKVGGTVDLVNAAPSIANGSWRPGKLIWGEILAVFLLFSLAYCPIFLARHGPYMEDLYFLVALQRMECGQLPYTDFAFLYGPLMIYPVWGWSQLFGTSMVSYFSFLALIEGLQFAILAGVLQFFIPERRKRYWAFLLLLPFMFNTLLGLNYNGLRRLVPAFALLLLAFRPFDRKANVLCGLLLGFLLAYSHEYAIAALVGVVGVYAIAFLRGDRVASTQAAALVVTLSAVVWAATMVLVLGDSLSAYVRIVTDVVEMMSKGHAAFEFYWTANSLALFGLLTIAVGAVGRVLFSGQTADMLPGDRLLIGGVLYAIVMLKSGLTRADLWHLNAGFLTLLIAFLLPLPSQATAVLASLRKTIMVLMIVTSTTYLIGIAPTGSFYATSYVRGFMDTVTSTRYGSDAKMRSSSIELERTAPRARFVELGSYLAAPERTERPVLFYGQAWDIAPLVGVCSTDYKLDNLMYSEFGRPEADYLKRHPDALVVLRSEDYENLYESKEPYANVPGREISPTKQLGRWLSTVHYDAADTENRLQNEARMRLTGANLPSTHKRAASFGHYVVLAPK